MKQRIHHRIHTFILCLSVILTVSLSSNAFSQSTNPNYAGSIVYAVGDVLAVDADGETRPLGRRADIYVGDTLYTGADSSAQLSMSDSAQIVLRESTVFQISAYTYQSGEGDSVVLELIEGGFRTVTGSVLKDQYRANVRGFSSIGIRGTEYEARKLASDRLLVGIYDGGITLSNFGGELDLGIAAEFDFAEVQSSFLPPVGLEVMPVSLDELQFAVALLPADQLQDGAANLAGTVGALDGNGDLVAAIDPTLVQAGLDIGDSATGDFFDFVASQVASADEQSAVSSQLTNTDGTDVSSSFIRNSRWLSQTQAIRAPDRLVTDTIDSLDTTGAVAVASEVADEFAQPDSTLLALVANADSVFTASDLLVVYDTVESIASVPVTEAVAGSTVSVETAADGVSDAAGNVVGDLVGDGVAGAVETADATGQDAVDGSTAVVTDLVGDLLASNVVEETVEVVAGGDSVAQAPVADLDTTVPAEDVVDAPTDTVLDPVVALLEEAEAVVEEVLEETAPEAVVDEVLDEVITAGSLLALQRAPAATAKEASSDTNWGAWNAPVPKHIADSMTISAGDYSVDITPTPLDNLTGSYSYSEVTGYEGQGSAGDLTSLQAGFNVDFNTGLISNGMLAVAVEDTQNWTLGFDGLIEQGVVNLNALGGSLIELSPLVDSISPISGDLSGAFTGAQAESFIGGFELFDLHNPLNTVEGIYTVER